MQLIKDMEQPLLRLLLTTQELDIIQQKDIRATVLLTEFGGLATSDGNNELSNELIATDIEGS